MDDEHADLQHAGLIEWDEGKPEEREMIPTQVEEGIVGVKLRGNEFQEKGDMKNLVKGAKVVTIHQHSQYGNAQKGEVAVKGMLFEMVGKLDEHGVNNPH
jgi:hypothetical protein